MILIKNNYNENIYQTSNELNTDNNNYNEQTNKSSSLSILSLQNVIYDSTFISCNSDSLAVCSCSCVIVIAVIVVVAAAAFDMCPELR